MENQPQIFDEACKDSCGHLVVCNPEHPLFVHPDVKGTCCILYCATSKEKKEKKKEEAAAAFPCSVPCTHHQSTSKETLIFFPSYIGL